MPIPIPLSTLNTTAPALNTHALPFQRRLRLPHILTKQPQLPSNEIRIHRIARPPTDIDNVETGVDETAHGGELVEDQGRCCGGGGYGEAVGCLGFGWGPEGGEAECDVLKSVSVTFEVRGLGEEERVTCPQRRRWRDHIRLSRSVCPPA